MARIGVENSLTDVQQALQQQGHEVVTLNSEQDAQGCDCCVVTGQDSNVMGIVVVYEIACHHICVVSASIVNK